MNKDEIIRQAMSEIYDLLEKHFQDKHSVIVRDYNLLDSYDEQEIIKAIRGNK